MNLRKTNGFVLSLISVAGINFTLLEMWLVDDFSGGQTMILYWLENIAAIFLAVIFVFLFAPKTDRTDKPRTRRGTIGFYLLLAIPFSVGSAIFFSFYAIHEMTHEINFSQIAEAMTWIAGFLILEFVADVLMIRQLTLFQAELFLNRSLGRVFLFFLSVFAGYFLIIFGVQWFVAPFLALKTMADIGAHVEMLTGYNDLEQMDNADQRLEAGSAAVGDYF